METNAKQLTDTLEAFFANTFGADEILPDAGARALRDHLHVSGYVTLPLARYQRLYETADEQAREFLVFLEKKGFFVARDRLLAEYLGPKEPGVELEACGYCEGSGSLLEVHEVRDGAGGYRIETLTICLTCDGEGVVPVTQAQ